MITSGRRLLDRERSPPMKRKHSFLVARSKDVTGLVISACPGFWTRSELFLLYEERVKSYSVPGQLLQGWTRTHLSAPMGLTGHILIYARRTFGLFCDM